MNRYDESTDAAIIWMWLAYALCAALALALVGCGAEPEPESAPEVWSVPGPGLYGRPAPDMVVDGIDIRFVGGRPSWADRSDFAWRFSTEVSAAARHFGGRLSDLAGWAVVFRDDLDEVECPGASPIGGTFDGCAHDGPRSGKWIELAAKGRSLEMTVLIHEVGHAIIWDNCHNDPRWRDFDDVVSDLQAQGIVVGGWRYEEGPSCQ